MDENRTPKVGDRVAVTHANGASGVASITSVRRVGGRLWFTVVLGSTSVWVPIDKHGPGWCFID